MILNKIDDPRSNLERAHRYEMYKYAQQNNITEIVENMPAILMRKILRSKGVRSIPIPNRMLGQPTVRPDTAAPAQADGVEMDMEDDMLRQWRAQQTAPKVEYPQQKPAGGINELRAECKRLGIQLSRRDNMKTMRQKIEEHGRQNAA